MELKIHFLLLLLVVYLYHAHAQLSPGGTNVCSRTISYNTYIAKTFTRIGYDNYRTCCKRVLRACVDRCTRYRSKIVSYTNSVLQIRYKAHYECCAGWARSGSTCPLPICNPGCKNGKCIRPMTCQCNAGFEGKYCKSDINECKKTPCSQVCQNLPGTYACACKVGFIKASSSPTDGRCNDVDECKTTPCKCAPNSGSCSATCSNTVGSFGCSCSSGFQLTFDKKTCIDIDECGSSTLNTCQHKCHNTPGAYMCSCNSGYVLNADKRTCSDVDECKTLNGGCNHKCVNQPGSFVCECQSGYRLSSNQRTCVDINECVEQKPCDNQHGTCSNVPGKYTCGCQVGYKLQTDMKTCLDINECASDDTNGCAHNCHNTDGSYTCSCKIGYRLNKNQRICDDVNECDEKTHACAHNCHNNVGSYTCSCRPGYKLSSDGRKCIALPCETITKPLNGQISCSGYVTDQHCNFSCDSGFYLTGSSSRMCQPTTTWSGSPATCNRKPCPNLAPPDYGSLLIPCIQLFGSTCVAKCNKGFYLVGSKSSECVMREEKTKWVPKNSSCEASKPCDPNPCQHGGACTENSGNLFTCDCFGTSYTGDTCNTGVIMLPSIPQLIVGQQSKELTIFARPDDMLEVRPFTEENALTFEPEKFIIYPSEVETTFKVTATKAGIFKVKYRLIGSSAPNFRAPKESTVYAYTKSTTAGKAVDISPDFYRNGCEDKQLLQCNRKLSLLSSCAWGKDSFGFIGARSNGIHVPLSLIGITDVDMNSYDQNNILYPIGKTKEYLKNRKLSGVCPSDEKCANNKRSEDSISYITSNNIFQRAYYSEVNKLLPLWLRVAVNMKEGYFAAENFQSAIAKGQVVKNIKACKYLLIKDNDEYSVFLPKTLTTISVLSSTKTTTNTDTALCILINLCRKSVDIALPSGQTASFDVDFKSVGMENVKMAVNALGRGQTSQKCVQVGEKKQCVRVNSYLDVSSSFVSSGMLLNINGKLWTDATEKDLLNKFEVKKEFVFEGSTDYKFNVEMLGKSLLIQGIDDKSHAVVTVGGGSDIYSSGSDSCPLCEDKGIKLSMRIASSAFKYESNRLSFEPETDAIVHIPYDVTGGGVSSVKNENQMKLKMRLYLNLIPTKCQQLKTYLEDNGHTQDATLLTKYCNKVTTSLTSVQTLINGNVTSFTQLKSEVDELKENAYDCNAQLNSLLNRFNGNNQVNIMIRILQLQFKQLDSLRLEANTRTVLQKEQGKIIFFTGKFCFHLLCLDQAEITLYDLDESLLGNSKCDVGCMATYKNNVMKDAIIVTAKLQKDVQITPRIFLKKNDGIRLVVNKHTDSIQGTITASVKYFGANYQTTFVIKDNDIVFEKNDVVMTTGLLFTVKGRSSVMSATWSSLVYNLRGVSYTFAKKLRAYAQVVYQTTANLTAQRLKGAMSNAIKSHGNLLTGRMKLAEIKMKEKTSSDELRLADASHKSNLNLLNTKQTEFDSYLKSLDPLFIKKNVESVCKLETCKESCVSMPVCQTCQDPVTVDVNTLECEQKEQEIKTSTVQQFKTQCELTKYAFIPYYTGSCKPDPNMQAKADAELEKSLVASGTAVGTMIGSVVPGIGTLLGGAIGAFVGFIGGLFNSCDKSYEVHTKKWIEQSPCTLLQAKVTTVTRPFSVCFDVKKQVQTGFKTPYTCNCKINDCIVKAKDVTCLVKNQNCQKFRQSFLKASDKVPQKFTNLYSEISAYEDEVASSFIKVQALKKTNDHNRREFERIENDVRVKEQDSNFANITYADAASILKMDSCIMKQHISSKNLSNILNIKNVQFDINLPLVNNIRLNVDTKHGQSNIMVPFVYDLESDEDETLKFAARKVIETTICQSTRKRRSLANENVDLPFKSWFVGDNITASTSQLSCVTLKKTLEFMRESIKKLETITYSAMRLQHQVDISEKKLLPTLSITFTADTNTNSTAGPVVKANRDLISSATKELTEIGEQVKLENVMKKWREEVEVFTGLNNITVCLGYDDCVEEAITSLLNLPSIYKVPKERYVHQIEEVKKKFNTLLHHRTTLEGITRMIHSIRTSLIGAEHMSLHCADPPSVSLLTSPNVTRHEGATATLRCSAKSHLPVTFYWTHHEKFMDGEHGSTLSIKVTSESAGVYQCFARSLVGNGTANETTLTVYQIPAFVEEPSDIKYVRPSADTANILLTCNVTSHPKASITWYYSFLTSSEAPRLLKNNSEALLRINNPDKSAAGFYFCEASNEFGKMKSRAARVDIVSATLSRSEFEISFDVIDANVTSSSFLKLTKRMTSETSGFPSELKVKTLHGKARTKVTIALTVSPTSESNASFENMLKAMSEARQSIANAAAIFVNTLLSGRSTLKTEDGRIVHVDNDTLTYGFKLNICNEGTNLHPDGFLCVECPIGSSGVNCSKCPVNTYANETGQAICNACKDGEITEKVGSRSEQKCIEKRLRKTDIVFLLDKSRSFLSNNAFEYETKKFLPTFMNAYKDINQTRFALITIDTYADVYLSLREYKNPTQLTSLLKYVNVRTYSKYISLGLMEVMDMFQTESHEERKKIVVVLTNGMSRHSRWGDAFEMTRQASFDLQNLGVHLIAVGGGRRIDFAEVQAIASYPKDSNTIFPSSLKNGVELALKQTDAFLLGTCYKPHMDIGFLIKFDRYRKPDKYREDEKKLLKLLKSIYNTFPTVPYYFLPRQLSHQDVGFEKMTQTTFEQNVLASHHHHKYDRRNVYKRIEEATLYDMTEDYRSLSKVKTLILITESALDVMQLTRIQNNTDDDISFANFVFNQPIIDRSENPVTETTVDEDMVLGYEEVEKYLEKMKSKINGQYCI